MIKSKCLSDRFFIAHIKLFFLAFPVSSPELFPVRILSSFICSHMEEVQHEEGRFISRDLWMESPSLSTGDDTKISVQQHHLQITM